MRQFLVSWISVLDSVPDLNMVVHLPAILDGIFLFLSDPNKVRPSGHAVSRMHLAALRRRRTCVLGTHVCRTFMCKRRASSPGS